MAIVHSVAVVAKIILLVEIQKYICDKIKYKSNANQIQIKNKAIVSEMGSLVLCSQDGCDSSPTRIYTGGSDSHCASVITSRGDIVTANIVAVLS